MLELPRRFWDGAGGSLLAGVISTALALAVFVLTRRHDLRLQQMLEHRQAMDLILLGLRRLQDQLVGPQQLSLDDWIAQAQREYERVLLAEGPKLQSRVLFEVVHGVNNAVLHLLETLRPEQGAHPEDPYAVQHEAVLQHLDDVERFLPQCRWKERFESIPRYPVPGEEGPNFYHSEGPHPRPDSALGVEWRRVMRRWRRGQVVGWIRFKAAWWQRFWARLRRPK